MKHYPSFVLMLALASVAPAENMVFPPDSGVKNVQDYGAKGDGLAEDTAAIQKAIDEVKGIPDTLYFPNGTYLVSNSVGIFNGKAHNRDRFLVYQGQSEAGTVIKLKDNCPGFDDPQKPRIVMSVYQGQGTGDAMRGYVRNLTVDVGSGNPAAVGLRFMANNSGAMDHVTIRSSDPKKAGKLGLDLTQGQIGPCLIKHVTVIGFDCGVEVAHTFSVVLEYLALQHQNLLGFFNSDGRTTLRGLKSINRVPAVRNKWLDLTLIEADLTGGSPTNTAIINEKARLLLRDIKQTGYGHLLQESGGQTHDGAALDEWYEGKAHALFGAEPRTLRLPIQETPEVPWETDLSRWVKVPWSRNGEDIGEVLQGAIDRAAKEGKTTIYFPRHARTYEYYILPCRTPTLGFEACSDMIDAMAEDQANMVILWIAGGFRSKKFPITWQYNAEHQNVRADFMGKLIRHAHTRGIKCLLGFTPFGYDGVNQYPREHPELKAIGPDGKPVAEFGIHCWGWNLCSAKPASQQFMLEYAREMATDFYPEADGLFMESSDYAICHCPECGPKHFDHEFRFVRTISDDIWARKPEATIVVYPHYFSGAKLRFSFTEAVATKQPFDPRWTLFFTPHSAALEPDLIKRAKGSWWWNEAPSRFDIPGIRAGAQKARNAHCTGFIPSLECYSYIQTHEEFGEPWQKGQHQVPLGFGWLAEGASPYRELPMRAARIAYHEYAANPDLSDAAFQAVLGRELFGPDWQSAQFQDALELCRVFGTDRDWTVPVPLTTPGLIESRRKGGRLDTKKRAILRDQLARVRAIAARHRSAKAPGAIALARIAQWLTDQWQGPNNAVLAE